MKITYICDVCGNASPDRAKIVRCEKQGRRRRQFRSGQVVSLQLYGYRTKGTITGFGIRPRTHVSTYRVTVFSDDQSVKIPGMTSSPETVEYPEHELRPLCN